MTRLPSATKRIDNGDGTITVLFEEPAAPARHPGGAPVRRPNPPRIPERQSGLPGGQPPTLARNNDKDVYFVQAANGLIKIGVSGDPHGRFQRLRTMSPIALTLLAVIPGAGAEGESALHLWLAAHRSHGEWFRPAPELIAFICTELQAQAVQPAAATFDLAELGRAARALDGAQLGEADIAPLVAATGLIINALERLGPPTDDAERRQLLAIADQLQTQDERSCTS